MARAVSVAATKPAEATVGPVLAVDHSVESPYHAPVMAPEPAPAPAPAKENEDLSAALERAELQQYDTALRELGCAMASDLGDLEESDMAEIGMKKYEIKRLQRLTSQGRGTAPHPTLRYGGGGGGASGGSE